jgi:uncharacterized protein YkwD
MAFVIAMPARAVSRLANFDQRILAAHNVERAKSGSPPLSWSPVLAADAARWAAHLKTVGDMQHDDSLTTAGENLWRGSKDGYTPEDMVTMWIDEKAAYKNGVFPDVSTSGQWEDVGHYTQVVWSGTAQVGCALGTFGDGDEVLVCRYMEGGNVSGQKAF